MKAWIELYEQHSALRSNGRGAVHEIRQVLKRYGEARNSIFESDIAQRLQQRNNRSSSAQEYCFADAGELLATWNHPDWETSGHRRIHLEDARLHIYIAVNKQDHIQALNLWITSKKRESAEPLAIAVHLPDDHETVKTDADRQGDGACGHAALHCHIGPTLDALPKLRVPLPALRPARALEWMLSQVVPAYEAAPWSEVRAALKLLPYGTAQRA